MLTLRIFPVFLLVQNCFMWLFFVMLSHVTFSENFHNWWFVLLEEKKKYLFYVKLSVCDAKVLYDFQLNINSERHLKQKYLKYLPWLENLSLDWENELKANALPESDLCKINLSIGLSMFKLRCEKLQELIFWRITFLLNCFKTV